MNKKKIVKLLLYVQLFIFIVVCIDYNINNGELTLIQRWFSGTSVGVFFIQIILINWQK